MAPFSVLLPWLVLLWLVNLLCALAGSLAAAASMRLPLLGLPLALLLWVFWPWVASPLLGPAFPDPFLRVLRWDPVFADGPAEALWPVLVSGSATLVLLGLALLSVVPALIERRRASTLVRSRSLVAVVTASAAVLAALFMISERGRLSREAALVDGPTLAQATEVEWLPEHLQLVANGTSQTTSIEGPARPATVGADTSVAVGKNVPASAWYVPYVGRNGAAVPVARLQTGGPYDFELVLPPGWSGHGCAAFTSGQRCAGEDANSDWLLITRAGAVEAEEDNFAAHAPGVAALAVYRNTVTALLSAIAHHEAEFIPVNSARPFWFASASVAMITRFGEEAVRTRMAHYYAALTTAAAITRSWEEQGQTGDLHVDKPPLWLQAVIDRAAFALGITQLDPTEAGRRGGARVNAPPLHPFLPGASESGDRQEFDHWWVAIDELLQGDEARAKRLLLRLATFQSWETPDEADLARLVTD